MVPFGHASFTSAEVWALYESSFMQLAPAIGKLALVQGCPARPSKWRSLRAELTQQASSDPFEPQADRGCAACLMGQTRLPEPDRGSRRDNPCRLAGTSATPPYLLVQ